MTEIEKMEEIEKMAEVIKNTDIKSVAKSASTQLATALFNAGYRKQSDTVREFAEKLTKAINYEWDNYNTKDKPDTYWKGKRNGLFTAINLIDELAEQYGKEE